MSGKAKNPKIYKLSALWAEIQDFQREAAVWTRPSSGVEFEHFVRGAIGELIRNDRQIRSVIIGKESCLLQVNMYSVERPQIKGGRMEAIFMGNLRALLVSALSKALPNKEFGMLLSESELGAGHLFAEVQLMGIEPVNKANRRGVMRKAKVPEPPTLSGVERRDRIKTIIDHAPATDYGVLNAELRELANLTRQEIATRLAQPLNEQAAVRSHDTYEDKKSLAKWVNAELRQFGLAIRCPKTSRPAFLVAHPGGQLDVGRFHLEITDSNGRPRRTVTSVTLPAFTLMVDLAVPERVGARRDHSR